MYIFRWAIGPIHQIQNKWSHRSLSFFLCRVPQSDIAPFRSWRSQRRPRLSMPAPQHLQPFRCDQLSAFFSNSNFQVWSALKGVPSAESSRSVRGLGKGVSGKPYPRLCDQLSVLNFVPAWPAGWLQRAWVPFVFWRSTLLSAGRFSVRQGVHTCQSTGLRLCIYIACWIVTKFLPASKCMGKKMQIAGSIYSLSPFLFSQVYEFLYYTMQI